MVQIIIDTEKDSPATLQKIARLLHQLTDEPSVSGDSQPFVKNTAPPPVQSSPDMFSMFNNELPSSAPQNYPGSADELIKESDEERDYRLQQY